ncbi:hypothetical protein BLNAU_14421 [Blattamonas nauphoetae]|uniref:Uncharacterized protein n=1 Tax=Blattamonas nauphoetae TaxID=2049346 RepID=A0ABQ9XGR5_9EUKA|nr:hypothetical protein BLNAU_14421 [Blattamonas nauphoetae]
METNSSSNHSRSIDPFNRDATPLFLRIEPDRIETVAQSSEPFLSLVDFIKEGNNLDDKATEQACVLLKRVALQMKDRASAERILFGLVPTRDGSCSRFTESIIPLLTSPNKELVKATLSFLDRLVLCSATSATRFDILEKGFFTLLPQSFYEQDIHLLANPELSLISIVRAFMNFLHAHPKMSVCKERHISLDTFDQTFKHNFLHPIQPFLDFVYTNRRCIVDSKDSENFAELLGDFFYFSKFVDELSQFVVTSSFAVAVTDTLIFFETNKLTRILLQNLIDSVKNWKLANELNRSRDRRSDVRMREHPGLAKLRDEGVEDEMEAFLRRRVWEPFMDCFISTGDG